MRNELPTLLDLVVALVPPRSVVGVTLEAGRLDWAPGAVLLPRVRL